MENRKPGSLNAKFSLIPSIYSVQLYWDLLGIYWPSARKVLIKSIYRSAEILKAIYSGVNRLTDISYSLNLNKSTTHRLLKALEKSGFITQDSQNRKYLPGHLIFRLASNQISSHQLLVVACHGEMYHLRNLTKESIALHIPIGSQRIAWRKFRAIKTSFIFQALEI